MDFTKTIRPASVALRPGMRTLIDVFCHIEFKGGKLSISGVIGPKRNGDAHGSCGQIDSEFAHRNPADNDSRTSTPYKPEDMRFASGWDATKWFDFLEIWRDWHLNDMFSGCVHQRKAGWDKRPIDPNKPLQAYGKHFEGQRSATWNMLTWITPAEHPEGLLTAPCPECGYKYGSAWLHEDVPASVLEFLRALPDTDTQPAWV